MNIYIARGDDTLGPYTPGEAAGLVKTGYLLPEDFAARNGDAAWVALSSLLPAETAPGAPGALPVSPAGNRPRRRWFLAVVVLACLAGGVLQLRLRTKVPRSQPSPSPRRPVSSVHPPTGVAGVKPVAGEPSPPPVNGERARLSGVIRLVSPDGTPTTLAAVRVCVYPLQELTPYLATKKTAVQAELDRLTPLIEAAESEKNARLAAERSARQAFLDAVPSSDLEPSLRFNRDQSQAAVKDAENDCRYLLDQRREASKGEAYFRDLPTAAAMADTNARGEFALDLPPGEAFAVAACVPQATRTRYWLVKISVGGKGQKTVVLSDDNEAATGSPESLILTSD